MEKEYLKSLVDKKMTTRQIATELNKSQTTVVYWLKKFELETFRTQTEFRICPKCREEKVLEEFYNRRGRVGASVYCKSCTGEQTKDRQKDFKQKCIEYKGGSCRCCGYNKCNSALEFHHIDPNEKEFEIKKSTSRSFNESIKIELDKCILVCANCHREIHAGLIKV